MLKSEDERQHFLGHVVKTLEHEGRARSRYYGGDLDFENYVLAMHSMLGTIPESRLKLDFV